MKILALLVDRANYGRMKPVLMELAKRPSVELGVMVAGTMTLERFGRAEDLVRKDGLNIVSSVYMEIEGGNPVTMAKSLGLAVIEFSSELQRLKPDFLLVIGDRYEALGAVMAAAFMNICVIHLQGGEVSGSIDESTRHAITKFAHYHFPATKRSGEYVVRMGENPARVFPLGCPSADVAQAALKPLAADVFKAGVGAPVDPAGKYLLVIYHPVTTAYSEQGDTEVQTLLGVLEKINLPTVWLWPNIDAGTDRISKELRRYRETHGNKWLRLFKNFSPEVYLQVLRHASCAIGNSSSFVRDAGFLGTPVVLLGERQRGREFCQHVQWLPKLTDELHAVIERQIAHGPYAPSELYGKVGVSQKIVDQILQLKPIHAKLLDFVER